MTRRVGCAIVTLAVLLAACAAPPIVPGKLHEVREQPLDSRAVHEDCVRMEPGDRLEYEFDARAPLAFNIHYHEGKVVVMPVTREGVRSDKGVFDPLTAQDYCLMWETGAQSTLLNYRVRFIRGGARR